jgi:hypothetical protein
MTLGSHPFRPPWKSSRTSADSPQRRSTAENAAIGDNLKRGSRSE